MERVKQKGATGEREWSDGAGGGAATRARQAFTQPLSNHGTPPCCVGTPLSCAPPHATARLVLLVPSPPSPFSLFRKTLIAPDVRQYYLASMYDAYDLAFSCAAALGRGEDGSALQVRERERECVCVCVSECDL